MQIVCSLNLNMYRNKISFFSEIFSIIQNKQVCLKISVLSLQKVICAEKKLFSIYRSTFFMFFFSFEKLFLHETHKTLNNKSHVYMMLYMNEF